MDCKFSRNQRVAAITKMLIENPNKTINLNTFTEKFNAAKSTISEDIVLVRESFNKLKVGSIVTVAGAAGGVKYVCNVSQKDSIEFLNELCNEIMDENRLILGSFLYLTDILSNPKIIKKAGNILASKFINKNIDFVVTVETKGIPLAYEVANMLGVELVIVRRDNKITEGTTISINYLSGSSGRIQTMSLSKKSLPNGSKCIFIDDFMKAGGTAVGIKQMLKEFGSELLGIGVLIDDKGTTNKLVDDYIALIDYIGIDGTGRVSAEISSRLYRTYKFNNLYSNKKNINIRFNKKEIKIRNNMQKKL